MSASKLLPILRLCLVLGVVLGAGTALRAQGFEAPDDLKLFWQQYRPAQEADDEEAMDKAVRQHKDLAEQTLDLMLDDLSRKDSPELHDAARALGRSLDRVDGQSRYMERVRFVLGLEPAGRLQRRTTMIELNASFDELNAAREEKSEQGWRAALARFVAVAAAFEKLGDVQYAIVAQEQCADLERLLDEPWERSRHLQRIVELGEGLPYKDFTVEAARDALTALAAQGIDPKGPKPEALAGAADGVDPAGAGEGAGGAGRGLTSHAPGSVDEVFALVLDAPKKGLSGVTLPSFAPVDQYLLWPFTWLEGNGPSEFDSVRPVKLQPFGKPFTISRDGAAFSLDSDGDGKPDLEFTPNPTPQRIDVPSPDGESFYPLMVGVPGDKEQNFGIETNYSPQPNGARLRFNLAGSMDGKVLGETWKVLDTNISGRYGDVQPYWDDRVTLYEDGDAIAFDDTDALLIGKARVALPWSTVLPVGEDFYRATITPDGSTLTLRKLNLETGFVKLDIASTLQPTHVILKEVGKLEGAYLNVVPAKKGGAVKVPVGTWQLTSGRFEKGAKTSMQQIRMYQGHSTPLEVQPGATATLALGGPYKLRMKHAPDGKTEVLDGRSLRVWGRGGEEYAMFFDDPLQPEVEVRTGDGKKLVKPEKLRRPGISEWELNTGFDNILWFPLDFVVENPKGEKLEFRVTQKAHPLLGGPFDSDWIP